MHLLQLLEEKYPGWTILYRMVRVNNKPYDLDETTPAGWYRNGSVFVRLKDFIVWTEFTALEHKIEFSSEVRYSHQREFLEGTINAFYGSYYEMDLPYLNELTRIYIETIDENYFDSVNEWSVTMPKLAKFSARTKQK